MDTPKRPGARGESPDPLSELDIDQGTAHHNSLLPSSALRRITRSQRSDSLYSLDQRNRMHTSRFSVSPRKRTFHLNVGDDESPQKIRVTVETENEDGSASPASNSASSVAAAQMPQISDDRVKRRLFRDTSQTPMPSPIAPSLPPSSTAATGTRRRLRSSSPAKSSAAPSAKTPRSSKTAIPKSVVTRTTKVPLRGLSDDEDDELDSTRHSQTNAVPMPAGTPKPKRGRPRRSGTPMPARTEKSPQASSPQPEVTPVAPAPSPAKRGRKPRAATPKIDINDDDNASAADELASVKATPMLESPQKHTSRAASHATPRSSNTPGAGRTPRPARPTRLSVTPSRTPAAANLGNSSGAESISSSFRVSRRGRGRPRRQAMAPDEMAAIAEERDEQAAAETRLLPEVDQLTERPPEQLPEPGYNGNDEDDGDQYYGAASPDPFLDLFPDANPVSRYAYNTAPRAAVSPAPTSLSSVDLINVQTPAAESTIMRDYDYDQSEYRGATSPLDLLRSQTDYSPEPQGAQHAEEDDMLHFSSAPSPYVQEHSAAHIELHSEAASEAQNDISVVQDPVTQSPALPQLPQEQPAVLPTTALPRSEVTDARSDGDVDPVHFSDGGRVGSVGPESSHEYYRGFDDGHEYVAESELGVGSDAYTYADSDRAGSSTPGGMTQGQNTIANGEDFSMIGLESLQSSFQLSRGPLPEMGEVTSRIVNHSLDAVRQDLSAAPGNDSLHDGASYLEFLTAGSSPSSAPSVVSAHRSPLLPGNRGTSATKKAQPVAQTPPRKTLSPNKKAMPLAKILGRKSVATPLRTVAEKASIIHGEKGTNDRVNDKVDLRTRDTTDVSGIHEKANDDDGVHDDNVDEQSHQYNDSFSEIPDAVLDAAAIANENDTVYFSQQQAELTGRVVVPPVTYMAAKTADPGSPIPPLPPSSPFPSSPAVSQPGRTPSRRQMVTSGPVSLLPSGIAPAEHDYAPSPLRQAVTPDRSDSVATTTPAVTASHSEAVHEPQSQLQSKPSLARSTQQVTAGAVVTPAGYTAESSPARGPVVTPDRASSALLELHTAEPVSSPPEQTNTNSRLQVQPEGFRPSLSPIVRAGRVLQSVTSSPPTPKDESVLRSPFRGGTIGSSPVPAPLRLSRTIEEEDDNEQNEQNEHNDLQEDSDSEFEHEPAKYELVEAQLQRETSASVAPSEVSNHSDSEPDFDGEDEDAHDIDEEQEPEAELHEQDEQDQEPGFEAEPEPEVQPKLQHVRPVRPVRPGRPESSPPPASSLRAWTLARQAMDRSRNESPHLRRSGSPPAVSAARASALALIDAESSPISSPASAPIITPTPAERPVSLLRSKRTADDASLIHGREEDDNSALPSFRKRARMSSMHRSSADLAANAFQAANARPPLSTLSPRTSSRSNRDRTDHSRVSAKTSARLSPLHATRAVQPTPANGIFAENTGTGSTGRSWRSLVFRENGIVGSISNFAAKLISRAPSGENTLEQSPQAPQTESQPEAQPETQFETQYEAEQHAAVQPEKASHPFFGRVQRESEQQREHEVERELELLEKEQEQGLEEEHEEEHEQDQEEEGEEEQEEEEAEVEETILPGTRRHSSARRQSSAPRYSDASSTHYGSDAIQSMINDISLEGRDAIGDVSALHGSALHGSSFYPREPEYQYEEEHEEEHEPEQDEGPEYEQDQPQRPEQPEQPQKEPKQHDQTLQPEEQQQHDQQQHSVYEYEPEPMDINSIHEPEQQEQNEPEPMDVNDVQPSTTPAMTVMNPSQSFYFGEPQSHPPPPAQPQSQGNWDDEDVDIWAIEAERTTRVSTMPQAAQTAQTAQTAQVPLFPAPALSAPPVTVSALSPSLSYRSTPLSPVEEVLSSSVVKPSSVLRSTPPIRGRRQSQPMTRPLRASVPVSSTPAPAPAPAPVPNGQSRFLDEFFSSPAALPQELAPTNEADVRFNEQARQRTMLEREQRRLGGNVSQPRQQAKNSTHSFTPAPAPAPAPVLSQPSLADESTILSARESISFAQSMSTPAASSSPAALASSPSRAGPRQNSSLGYFSQQMEMIANSPQGSSLANFFEHTYPEEGPRGNSQPQQPQQIETFPATSQPSGVEITPQSQSAADVDIEDSTFLTPELRPLPPRSASPTKSCIRPRTKPKVTGRVVVIQEGNADRGIPERITYGEEVMQDRASSNSNAQQFAMHFGIDEEAAPYTAILNPGGMVQQAAENEYPGVSHASSSLDNFQTQPGFQHFHDTRQTARGLFRRPASIAKMPERDWTILDWVALNEVVHALRGSYVQPPSKETFQPYQLKGRRSKTKADRTWVKYLEAMCSQSEEARHQRHSHVLLGKVVHTDIMAMLVKRWHLDIVDAFLLRSGRIWNEHFVLRRLFSLLLSETHRGAYVPGGQA